MTFAEYQKVQAANWSSIRELAKSPLAYRYRLSHPQEDSDTLRFGRATHTAILEPGLFSSQYAVWDGGRRAGKEWAEFCEENAARTILTEDQAERALRIAESVRAHPVATKYLRDGQAERVFEWTDFVTGLRCKGRVDYLSPGHVVDLKSTRAIDERSFSASVGRYRYHAQMAFYLRGIRTQVQTSIDPVLIAFESEPPHDCAVYWLGADAIATGDREIGKLLAKLVECHKTDTWPGQFSGEVELRLPKWALEEAGPIEDPTWITEAF